MHRFSSRLFLVVTCGVTLVASAILTLRHEATTQSQLQPLPARAAADLSTHVVAVVSASPPAQAEPSTSSHQPPEIPSALLAACGEWEPERRARAIEAALRAWATHDLQAASAWAHAQSFLARAIALAAVVNGAAERDPAMAERYVANLMEAEPAQAVEYGGFLVFALGEAGEHARAATWAAHRREPQPEWLAGAYGRWAREDAPAAWTAANAVHDDYARHLATRATLNAWAKSQPAQVLEYARAMPDGPEKSFALTAALRTWAAREPERAASWIREHGDAFPGMPRPELILED